jgi:RHS repeat-associated protein
MGSKSKMPAARLGDVDTGHGSSEPTAVEKSSENVLINGRGAARQGDMLVAHHSGVRTIIEGAGSVLINGKPAARVSDAINCGGKLAVGSANVLIGDSPKAASNTKLKLEFQEFMTQSLASENASFTPYQEAQLAADIAVKYRGSEGGVATWHDYFNSHEPEASTFTDPLQKQGYLRAQQEKDQQTQLFKALFDKAGTDATQQADVDGLGILMQQAITQSPAGASVTPLMSTLAGKMLVAAGASLFATKEREKSSKQTGDISGNSDEAGSNPAGNATPKISQSVREGEPINMVTGEEVLELEDFVLDGPLPLIWQRVYRSSNAEQFGLGVGWTHPASLSLTISDDKVIYQDEEGRTVPFCRPSVGSVSVNQTEKLKLLCIDNANYSLFEVGKPDRLFCGEQRLLLSAIVDTCANRLDFCYHDDSQRLSYIRSSWGPVLIFQWHEGLISEIKRLDVDKNECRLVGYEYSADQDLISCLDKKHNAEHYQYRNHIITKRTLKSGFSFYFDWDQYTPSARCLKQSGDNGIYSYRFEWDNEQRISRAIDSGGNVKEYHYNKSGRVVQEIDPEGLETFFDYDEFGNLLQRIGPCGIDWYEYNEHGQITSYRDPAGGGYQTQYAKGLAVCITDALGNQWSRSYYDNGLVQKTRDPEGKSIEYFYNSMGLLCKSVGPLGTTSLYEWDRLGRLITQNINQCESHYQYDGHGRIDQISEHQTNEGITHTTQFSYDAGDNITKVRFPDNTTQHLQYNGANQLTCSIDSAGRETQYVYDGLAQVRKKIDPMGQVFEYQYDNERNLVGLINEKGERYQLKYDRNERLIEEIGFDGRVQQYGYNEQGQLSSHIEGVHTTVSTTVNNTTVNNIADNNSDKESEQQTTYFERDAIGRLTEKRSPGNMVSQYSYDVNGRLTSAINEHISVAFEYTPCGLLAKEIQGDQTIEHRYNDAGQRTSTFMPDSRKINYDFDQLGRWSAISIDGRQVASVQRNEWGLEVQREQGELQTQYQYDPMARLTRQTTTLKQSKQNIIRRDYQFDWAGNLNAVDDFRKGRTHYQYDSLDRLIQVSGTKHESFQFDPTGNIAEGILNSPERKGNRLSAYKDQLFEYDESAGNIIFQRQHQSGADQVNYLYNGQNQLTRVQSSQSTTHYHYDALGRRISKEQGKQKAEYLWSGDVLLSEHKNGREKLYIYEPNSFKPLAQVINNQIFHYHLDHLGTPQEISNQYGGIVWSGDYSAFGGTKLIDVESIENNLRFQGQYFDDETGFHYNRYRYYNPRTGQYISQDPIGLLGGVNHYRYAPNPTGWIDPYGLTCKEGSAAAVQSSASLGDLQAPQVAKKLYEVESAKSGSQPESPASLPKSYIEAQLQKLVLNKIM